jgi:phosphoserine phosphatase RsbU/P
MEAVMPPKRVLIVAEPCGSAEELSEALRAGDMEVEYVRPGDLAEPKDDDERPDVILVGASLGLKKVSLLGHHFELGGRVPTTMVFADDDAAALEACVTGGFDYIVPPFLPALVQSRMTSSFDRWSLARTVEDMVTERRLREYEKEMSVAHDIQAGFLPGSLPSPDGWEISARFKPARQVGGDFYDVFELINGGRIAFVVADVCDKGLGAALFMSLIRTLLRHTAEHTSHSHFSEDDMTIVEDSTPGAETAVPPLLSVSGGMSLPPLLSISAGPLVQAVIGTNRYLTRHHLDQGYFATMFFGVLDPESGELVYINGGHNPPVLSRADGSSELLDPTGPAVGMLPDCSYSLGHVCLDPGDALLIYTDGVTDARDSGGKLFGTDRMMVPEIMSGQTAAGLIDALYQGLQDYIGTADQFDDITMVAVRRTAP